VSGVLCGSIYLNKRFRSALEKKLQEEDIQDIEAKIERAVTKFDEVDKTAFNGTGPSHPFKFEGLQNDPEKGFMNSCVWLSA
jgi:hypothetical protein